MPDVADENASLEDSRTTLVDTIERSTPESEADRSNIFETRYIAPQTYRTERLLPEARSYTRIGGPVDLSAIGPGY